LSLVIVATLILLWGVVLVVGLVFGLVAGRSANVAWAEIILVIILIALGGCLEWVGLRLLPERGEKKGPA
jgi:hypothetical protein